jgi:serine protease Do
MKRYLLTLALMVLCASALVVAVAYYRPGAGGNRSRRRKGPPPPALAIDSIVERVGPSVVAINTIERKMVRARMRDPLFNFFFGGGDFVAEREGIGSGVIFDPGGYALTNAHVVSSAQEIAVVLPDGRQAGAAVCAVDREGDLALIRIEARGLPVAELGESEGLRVGQIVLAFGNPFGTASKSAQPSVTFGVISGLRRDIRVERGRYYRDLIQTDAAINIGNNGGPLVDLTGRVIGLNTLIVTSSGASTGVGFAIPVDFIMERLDDLRAECARGARSGRRR